jgi:hypothetical protein
MLSHLSRCAFVGALLVVLGGLGGCRGIRIGEAEVSSAASQKAEKSSKPPAYDEERPAAQPAAPAGPFVALDDLQPKVAAAEQKLATDPAGGAQELASLRAEILARWTKLESTQPQPNDGLHVRPTTPFYSDTLTKGGKDLLATTHAARAGLWADQGKIDDALREMITTMSGVDAVPCPSTGTAAEACQRARTAVLAKYKGFCFNNSSSRCGAALDDDQFAFPGDKSKSTVFAQAWVKKVVARGKGGGVDVVTGDVPATDLDVCKGEFQTDKILDVNEKRILIERTTWCREMAKQRRVGWRITHHLGKLPFAIKPGDHLVLIADAAKVKRTKVGETIVVDSESVVVAANRDRPLYRWNEVTP